MKSTNRTLLRRALTTIVAGVGVTALALVTIPASAAAPGYPTVDALCAKMQGNVLSRYTADSGTWTTIGSNVREVYAGAFGTFATFAGRPGLFRNTTSNSWTRVSASTDGAYVVTGSGLFNLSSDGSVISQYVDHENWKEIGGPAEALYGGGNDLVAVDADGDVHRYTSDDWSQIGTDGGTFAVSSAGIYRLAADGSGIYQYVSGTRWSRIGPAAEAIAVGTTSTVVALTDRRVTRYDARAGWVDLGSTTGTTLAVTDHGIFSATAYVIERYNGELSWTRIGSLNSGIVACR